MAIRQKNVVKSFLEFVVANPLYATFTVGFSILILLQIISFCALLVPAVDYLRYLAPFIPPFIITRTAKSINRRSVEHEFVKDAEPYIFIAYLNELSESALMSAKAEMVSDSASRHLSIPLDEIFNYPVIPASQLTDTQFLCRLPQDGHI